ncbi:GGDEF domain-containing protein [Stutzerimonas stutzeri]|uniref:sensor domain-containing diguanylate cyclase n=1 Tax=Stutzerimonas TaxID=2901164 RepID=UPI000C9C6A36|nr:GGDEF domain-containing protein [Stutzerimonas stutzeri]PNG15895.1 diguanylate cyclase [Stutzerimonas stutzeri]QUE77036.1 diguanylate cyclase [Stutzerimonas stutzeri]
MKAENRPALATVLDLMLDAVCVVDVNGRFVYVSAACERIFGYTPDEMIGRSMMDMVAPEDHERTLQAAKLVMSGQPSLHFENRYVRKDGQLVDIMWSARWSEEDQLRVGVARDITQRKHSESLQAAVYALSEAAHNTADLTALFEQIHLIIGKLIPAASFFVALNTPGLGPPSFPYCKTCDPAPFPLESVAALCAEVTRTGQALLLTKDRDEVCSHLKTIADTDRYCWLAAPLSSRQGNIGALLLNDAAQNVAYREQDRDLLQFVANQVATAIERKQLHARLERMAQYDELTGLPNRAFLFATLKTALARARRNGERLSLLYLDLNKFKQVNDHHGHGVGDLLLQAFASRLTQHTREADTVARMGGDEFVVLLENSPSEADTAVVVANIRAAMQAPVELAGLSLAVQPSIGIAYFPTHGHDEASLLNHADASMYGEKSSQAAGEQPSAATREGVVVEPSSDAQDV